MYTNVLLHVKYLETNLEGKQLSKFTHEFCSESCCFDLITADSFRFLMQEEMKKLNYEEGREEELIRQKLVSEIILSNNKNVRINQ